VDAFQERYSLLYNESFSTDEDAGEVWEELKRSGAVRFVQFGKIAFNEEAVTAAEAALILRKQGQLSPFEVLKESVQQRLESVFAAHIGTKMDVKKVVASIDVALRGMSDVGDHQIDIMPSPPSQGGGHVLDVRVRVHRYVQAIQFRVQLS
jgi:hypothetical protein